MPITRTWQRDLDAVQPSVQRGPACDVCGEPAQLQIIGDRFRTFRCGEHVHETVDGGIAHGIALRVEPIRWVPTPIDFAEYAHAALDGAVGDLDLKTIRTRADAWTAIEGAVVEKIRRPLDPVERIRLQVAITLELKRRNSERTPQERVA